jgi:hypothetical protein
MGIGADADPEQIERALMTAIGDVLADQGIDDETARALVFEHVVETDVRRIISRHLEEALDNVGYDSAAEVRKQLALGLTQPDEIGLAVLSSNEHRVQRVIEEHGDEIVRKTLAEIIALLPLT